ncbi:MULTISPECIES: GAP family protein [unclassified Streptomyces]|uniref:GAP family protein n=1 Tax=unclassified Streptomyces TaxID=2593676 RepID=UPI0023657DA0|nr:MULTISPECIES: GAP family protein [unclassified Streptomyces]MDF3146399.1 GAP family protein [Streptomyces sp. T21Q-yed]WDF37772.1 GAP family protein [Streptomyces sp. T12]
MDGLNVLPLAVTMMAGPQIMSAIIFVTTPRAVRVSVAFLVGVAAATTVGTAITWSLASLFDLGDPGDSGSSGKIIQYVLVGLLVAAAIKNWVRRESIQPPKWLGTLMSADPRKALKVGLLIILLMPSDIVVMLTVGTNLAQADANFAEALPFIAATVLIAALPLLFLLLFHRRAIAAMPHVRDWMNTHSWLINIIVCGIFILLILA